MKIDCIKRQRSHQKLPTTKVELGLYVQNTYFEFGLASNPDDASEKVFVCNFYYNLVGGGLKYLDLCVTNHYMLTQLQNGTFTYEDILPAISDSIASMKSYVLDLTKGSFNEGNIHLDESEIDYEEVRKRIGELIQSNDSPHSNLNPN